MSKDFSMIDVVRAQFKNNLDEELLKCKNASNLCFERNLPTRAFDDFPCLLPETIFTKLVKEFESLINSVILFKLYNDDLELEKEISIKFIDFLLKIAVIGQEQLMNQQNRLSENVIEEYEWQKYKEELQVGDLMCAFVGNTFQAFVKTPAIVQLIKTGNVTALTTVFDFINKNYGLLVAEHLNKFNIKYTPGSLPPILKRIAEFPKKHPVVTALTVAATVGLGIAGTLFTIFVNSNNNNQSSVKPLNKKLTP